ncbi:SAM-dependent methyltransferase [Fulvitalea axinellae]|uniref:SAM-dependent methyltransferase n=1 Tax=Fulvitalea axinellae TaxID=1182444 RepID=A0AAU9DAI3_9BACT|nr:SAM-dependent methyltransferase [Fulvitalea axinellae]
MRLNTNSWNRLRYTFYAPFYDRIAEVLEPHRKRSIQSLELGASDKVLVLGAGTGLDLPYLRGVGHVSAGDISPAMVEKIRSRSAGLGKEVDARILDGQNIDYPDSSFDAVVLHLIVAVIPDPYACMREVVRVLKPGGTVAVFDKFVKPGEAPGLARRLANLFTSALFSDITRDIDKIIFGTGMTKISDIPVAFGGNFRVIKLLKNEER